MVDSGATRTVVTKQWVEDHEEKLPWLLNCDPVTLVAADGANITLGQHLPQVNLKLGDSTVTTDILVIDDLPDGSDGLFGLELLTAFKARVDFKN